MEALKASTSQGYGKYIYIAVIFIVLAVSLYYFYNWIKGDGDLQSVVLYSSPTDGIDGKSDPAVLFTPKENVPPLYEGGEYSVSTWIYITKWDTANNKPFLTLDGGSDASFLTLVMYLGKATSKLGIRVSTDTASTTLSASTTTIPEGIQLTPSVISDLIGTQASGISPMFNDTDLRKCDIEEVGIQRWVNITAVLNGRTLDVYIDGKMSRSCVLASMFKVSGSSGARLSIGNKMGFGGIIGTTQAANFALSPGQIYNIYQAGPIDASVMTQLKQWVDPNMFGVTILVIVVLAFASQGLEPAKASTNQ